MRLWEAFWSKSVKITCRSEAERVEDGADPFSYSKPLLERSSHSLEIACYQGPAFGPKSIR
jgi:hypothetical protein